MFLVVNNDTVYYTTKVFFVWYDQEIFTVFQDLHLVTKMGLKKASFYLSVIADEFSLALWRFYSWGVFDGFAYLYVIRIIF